MDCITTVRNYIANGFNCLPLQLDGSKQPVGAWSHLKQRLVSDFEIAEFWKDNRCGIGVLGGPISGNLVPIDFDHQAETYFKQFWNDAQRAVPGVLDKLLVVQTPRPGYQVWIRQQSAPAGSQHLALGPPAPTGEYDEAGNEIHLPELLIETRSSGFAVAVGSPAAVHKHGTPYQLIHGTFDNLPQLLDSEAETLLAICRSYSQYIPDQVQRQPGEKYEGEPRPGDVYNRAADIRQLLLDAGWQHHHSDGETEYLTRPGKAVRDGYSATLGYVRDDDNRPLLYVHSPAAVPFKKDSCYDAFGVYATVHHGGDFGKAAAQVRIDYADQVQTAQAQFHAEVRQRFDQQTGVDVQYKPFPLDALDDVLAGYVQEHATAIDIDAAYIAVPLLAVAAGLIGPSRQIQLKRSWVEPAVLWTVTVGKPSSGKSPGWETALAPANAVQSSLHLANKQAQESYRQAMDGYKESKRSGGDVAEPSKPGPAKQLVVDDITMESLARVHQHNDRLILACEELAAWVNGMDQYRGGKGRDSQGWLRMYGGGSLSVNRVTDDFSLYIPRSSVSVTGTIQPGVATETLFAQKNRNSGFAFRILAVSPPARVMGWSDSEPSTQVIQNMVQLAQQLYGLQQERYGESTRPLSLPCSDEALLVFRDFVGQTQDIAEAASDDGESRWVKLRAVAARFALVLGVIRQLLHQPDNQAMQPIDAEAMRAGIELALWFGHEMERSWLSISGGDADLMGHYDWVCSKYPSGLDVRTFQQGRRNVQTADDARRWFQLMTQAGLGSTDSGLFVPFQNTASTVYTSTNQPPVDV